MMYSWCVINCYKDIQLYLYKYIQLYLYKFDKIWNLLTVGRKTTNLVSPYILY